MSAVVSDVVRSENALRVASLLEADYRRQGSVLFQTQVDRVVERRKLGTPEILAMFEYLAERRISIKDDTDLIDEGGAETGEESESGGTISLKAWQINHSLLSASEEKGLGRQVLLGKQALASQTTSRLGSLRTQELIARGIRARDRLVAHNVRLVVAIARKYLPISGMAIEDLVQEGVIGLMRAIDLFDPSLGYRFSTYATWWIRQRISRCIADRGRTVRLPVHIHVQLNRVRFATKVLTRLNGGKSPTLRQLSDELEFPIEKVQFLRDLVATDVISLDAPRGDGNDGSLADVVVDCSAGPDALLEDAETAVLLRKALGQLSVREQKVLALRFGIDRGSEMTLEQVGKIFDLTRERIRQIQEKALKRLRAVMRAMNIDASAFTDDALAEHTDEEVVSES